MPVAQVFVASSSEGLGVVKALHASLQRELDGSAVVTPWTEAFQLNKAYIESLEDLLDASDFAVLVLTPDDRTNSRESESWSPRDNVVFEMGLFFGRLGRERCVVLKPDNLDLKLPSDLLGIELAHYSPSAQPLEAGLESVSSRIGQAIGRAIDRLPSRPKLDEAGRAVQGEIRKFGDRIAGTWWERIHLKGEEPSVGLFDITLDDIHSSVRFVEGTAYSASGVRLAHWRSAGAHLEGQRVLYVRECRRLDDGAPGGWLPGHGEVNFEGTGAVLDRGHGNFWESDASNPRATVIKDVELRRATDASHASTMRQGGRQERQALVSTLLDEDNW